MVWGIATVKLLKLVPVPAAAVTLIGPVVAPTGTFTVISLSFVSLAAALVVSNVTPVVPVKFEPYNVTDVPAAPVVGTKLATDGMVAPHCCAMPAPHSVA